MTILLLSCCRTVNKEAPDPFKYIFRTKINIEKKVRDVLKKKNAQESSEIRAEEYVEY